MAFAMDGVCANALIVNASGGTTTNYGGTPAGMGTPFGRSFRRELETVLGFDSEAAGGSFFDCGCKKKAL